MNAYNFLTPYIHGVSLRVVLLFCVLYSFPVQATDPVKTAGGDPSNDPTVSPLDQAIEKLLEAQEVVTLDLFVMSQCPFAVQAEQAMAPILKKYGQQVDFNLYFIATQNTAGTFESMHGPEEVAEDIRQLVIAKLYPDKLMDYLTARAENYQKNEWRGIAQQLDIDIEKVQLASQSTLTQKLFKDNIDQGIGLSIGSSPTLLLDNVAFKRPIFLNTSSKNHQLASPNAICFSDADCTAPCEKCYNANPIGTCSTSCAANQVCCNGSCCGPVQICCSDGCVTPRSCQSGGDPNLCNQPCINGTCDGKECKGSSELLASTMVGGGNPEIFVTGRYMYGISISNNFISGYGHEGNDIMVARYDANDQLIWLKRAGGIGDDVGMAIATDVDSHSVITGRFSDKADFDGLTLTSADAHDVFLALYDINGDIAWAQSAGGAETDVGTGIVFDQQEDIIVCGYFKADLTFDRTTLNSSGGFDLFVAKYNHTGQLLWARRAGGLENDVALNIAVDREDNILLTGYFTGAAGFESLMVQGSDQKNLFVAKYDPSGNLLWVKKAEGGNIEGRDIAIDANNNILVAGSFTQSITWDQESFFSEGKDDLFVTKLQSDGQLLWIKTAGGPDKDFANGITCDATGQVMVCGNFKQEATFDTATIISAGEADIFIAKYLADGTIEWVRRQGGTDNDFALSISSDQSGQVAYSGCYFGTSTIEGETFTSITEYELYVARFYESIDSVITSNNKSIESSPVFKVTEVYPNPFSQALYIKLQTPIASRVQIKITDILGTIVYGQTSELTSGEQTLMLNINDLTDRVYLLELQDEQGKTLSEKIIRKGSSSN